MVSNSSELSYNQVFKGVQVAIQDHIFEMDLFVMPIGGADLVLGVEWLKGLCPIVTDYASLTIRVGPYWNHPS